MTESLHAAERAPHIAVIGAGPAGLMAAEAARGVGCEVTVYDRMPSPGRKFLLAGRSGLNLTHSEPFEAFASRYGPASDALRPALDVFGPAQLRVWAEALGQETFVGSSGRVFPRAWKASPLLRAWLARLDASGVTLRLRHLWTGFAPDGGLTFLDEGHPGTVRPDATILALGGASWPRLGSDGSWQAILAAAGIETRPLAPANCGLLVEWSDHVRTRFAGEPLKRAALSFGGLRLAGEPVVTATGLEGSPAYGLSGAVRDALAEGLDVVVSVDLKPDRTMADLTAALSRPRGSSSLSTFLRKAGGLPPVAAALMREAGRGTLPEGAAALAALAKAVPVRIAGVAGLDRAISSAGGVALAACDERLMLRGRPGVFAAGEMLDWEAPTGGYLLQACFATGRAAGLGAAAWLASRAAPVSG